MTETRLANSSLVGARQAKEDEFYTQLSDIERELRHYKKHFKGKVVYCNCDDPRVSNFFHYFSYNFEKLGLKKLITTCYKSQERRPVQPERLRAGDLPRVRRATRTATTSPTPTRSASSRSRATATSAARSASSCSSRPTSSSPTRRSRCSASTSRSWSSTTRSSSSSGTRTRSPTRRSSGSSRSNKIWLGVHRSGDMAFRVPDYYTARSTGYWVDEDGQEVAQRRAMPAGSRTLTSAKRHEDLILYKTYNPADYPTYDNYDAIEVAKAADIPVDYDGVMGVPITFLDKYNPDQFEIVGTAARLDDAADEVVRRSRSKSSTAYAAVDTGTLGCSSGQTPAARTYYDRRLLVCSSTSASSSGTRRPHEDRAQRDHGPRPRRGLRGQRRGRASSAYGGKLDIRPPYQREFVYKDKQRDAVIETLTQGLPAQRHVLGRARRRRLTRSSTASSAPSPSASTSRATSPFEGRYFHNLQTTSRSRSSTTS